MLAAAIAASLRVSFSPYGLETLSDGPRGEYLTDREAQRPRVLSRKSLEPFFVYLPHYAVHTPIQAKEEAVQTIPCQGARRRAAA